MIIMIAHNSRAHKRGESLEEFERRGILTMGILTMGMVQPGLKYVAPCVKDVVWVLGTRGLKMVAVFWTGIPVGRGYIGGWCSLAI